MRNHGPFTVGKDARAAVKAAVMSRTSPAPCTSPASSASRSPIAPADVDALYDRYQNVYGQGAQQ